MLSDQVYEQLRADILQGLISSGQPLRPQELAGGMGVSLAVVREALLRLVGDGLADRLPNRGFAVPTASDERWQQICEARCAVEPTLIRMAVERGDLDWEVRVRATHHRLARTPPFESDEGPHFSQAWDAAHHDFHRALLEGCGNWVLMDTFERLWTVSDLGRRWSAHMTADRHHLDEHGHIAEAALARDADAAARLLFQHLSLTAVPLVSERDSARQQQV